jgi:hypothetical protein
MWGCGLQPAGEGKDLGLGCCEHKYEYSGFHRGGIYGDNVSDC